MPTVMAAPFTYHRRLTLLPPTERIDFDARFRNVDMLLESVGQMRENPVVRHKMLQGFRIRGRMLLVNPGYIYIAGVQLAQFVLTTSRY